MAAFRKNTFEQEKARRDNSRHSFYGTSRLQSHRQATQKNISGIKYIVFERHYGRNISAYTRNSLREAVDEANHALDVFMWDGDFAYEYICGKFIEEIDFQKASAANPHSWSTIGGETWTADVFPLATPLDWAMCVYSNGKVDAIHYFSIKGDAANNANDELRKFLDDILEWCPDNIFKLADDADEIPHASCHWGQRNWDAFVVPISEK